MQRSEKKWSLWAKPIIGAKLVEDRRQKNILGKKFYFSWFVTPGLTKLFKSLSGYSNRNKEQKWIHDLIRIVGLVHNTSKSKCISRKSGLKPCHKTILNCFALEHSAVKTKHLKMSEDME